MWDIPRLYVSACSSSVQLVPLHPIVISILFRHYKDLKECISEVKQIEVTIRATYSSSKKKEEWLRIKEEEEGEEEKPELKEGMPPTILDGYILL
jgi:hypothetical protein